MKKGDFIVEKIKFLCCSKDTYQKNIILEFVELLENKVGITKMKTKLFCLADMMDEVEPDEENQQYYEPYEYKLDFLYKDENYILQATKITYDNRLSLECEIEYCAQDDFVSNGNSTFYEFKEKVIESIENIYTKVFWLLDTQNTKIATDLYFRIHQLENYLREIIDDYMVKKYGYDWFEKYSFEDQLNKYKGFAVWFEESGYDLFKKVDYHLYNLQTDDLFELLKEAKKRNVPKVIANAIKDIKNANPGKAEDILRTEYASTQSLWDEEHLDKAFNEKMVSRWKNDFTKRRNMIAHNKMICRKMYIETLRSIKFFFDEFSKAESLLQGRIISDEKIELRRLERDYEIAYNLEMCDLETDVPDNQEIIERINESDDFMEFRAFVTDELERFYQNANDVLQNLEEIYFDEEEFFEEATDDFKKELFIVYLELLKDEEQYSNWVIASENMNRAIFRIVAEQLEVAVGKIIIRIKNMIDSYYSANFDDFSDGVLLRFDDQEFNDYKLYINDWFSPERGSVDDINIYLYSNEEITETGGFYASYGDYEMTNDDLPIPSLTDEFFVNTSKITAKLYSILEEMQKYITDIEEIVCNLEI